MSLSDIQLANNVKATLADPLMSKVNFNAKGFTMGTMHYQIVSALITRGEIKCKVDASQVTIGAGAIYDHGSRTIFALTADARSVDVKETYVHECTHAWLHFMGWGHVRTAPFNLKVLANETLAFIGGAMFVVASPQQITFVNSTNPRDVAFNIVKAKGLGSAATNAGSPIDFTDQELLPLEQAIKGNALYKKSWSNSANMSI